MAFGYEAHPQANIKPGAPTPFHHPPRPQPERSRTAPMPIRTASSHAPPPPPLPPPRNLDPGAPDLGWHMANREGRGLSGENTTPLRAGSSILGGAQRPRPGKPFTVTERSVDIGARREAPRATSPQSRPTPPPPLAPNSLLHAVKGREEIVPASPPYHDLRGLMEYNKLHSEKPMSSDSLRRSSQTYDQQMLAKIGAPQGQTQTPGSSQQAAAGSRASPPTQPMMDMQNTFSRLNGQLKNFGASVGTPPPGLRSPLSDSGLDRYPLPSYPRRYSSAQRDSSERSHKDRLQTSGMAELSIQDHHPGDYQHTKTGQKRRANSPPSTTTSNATQSPPTQHHARDRNVSHLAGDRAPPTAQYRPTQPASGALSVASTAPSNSYLSFISGPSGPSTVATSYSSTHHHPDVSYQSAAHPHGSMPQYMPAHSNAPSQPMHNMGPPSVPDRKLDGGVLRASGWFMCDCCPKKPRKFDKEHDLRLHEMEKQYICQFCHNRFKNKNEAERHQNSLHLRKHSWSCSVLTSFEDAFHSTPPNSLAPAQPHPDGFIDISGGEEQSQSQSQSYQALHSTATDTCGYCGQEFVNPPNWPERVDHLNTEHKFGECNQTKKFFRADHFRQHLKHSHAGTSGKWTNELEKACMKDEPPPTPLPGMPNVHNAVPGGTPGIMMVGQQALLAQHQLHESARRAEEQAQAQYQHQAQQAVANVAQHQRQSSHPTTAGSQTPASAEYANPDHQFPGMKALQQYRPEHEQQRRPPPPQPPVHAQSLAEHLQQAQREMNQASKQSESTMLPTGRMDEDRPPSAPNQAQQQG